MKCNKVTSINSALQIDFTGQVNAESLGQYQMSGIGGQVDFVRGSQMSPGGKSIIAFTSTAAKGTKSKIVPFLDYGSKVTTSRYDVEYVITEYGILLFLPVVVDGLHVVVLIQKIQRSLQILD